MTDLHPFEGATNRTAIFVCRLSDTTPKWPIKYEIWRLKEGDRVPEATDIDVVLKNVVKTRMGAIPMNIALTNSAWLTAPDDTLPALKKVMGRAEVKAHAGVCTWTNGVFWLRSVAPARHGKVQIANWHDVGKIKVEAVTTVIEDDLVFPLYGDVMFTDGGASHPLIYSLPKTPRRELELLRVR